jgi:hypothetical protein
MEDQKSRKRRYLPSNYFWQYQGLNSGLVLARQALTHLSHIPDLFLQFSQLSPMFQHLLRHPFFSAWAGMMGR